jgi:MFS family permease
LIEHIGVSYSKALLGLTFFVAGMTLMRLAVSIPFRKASSKNLLIISFFLVTSALIILYTGNGFYLAAAALFILGAGLASGFPVILGMAGELFRDLSATAFSIVLTIGLAGNMTLNFCMGLIAERYGIKHLITLAFSELAILTVLALIIFNNPTNEGNG